MVWPTHKVVSLLVRLLAVLWTDFSFAFLPPSLDVLALVVFFLCLIFLIASVTYSRKNAVDLLNVYFWADIVGIIALLPDLHSLFRSNSTTTNIDGILLGFGQYLGETNGDFRLSRFGRVFRMMRLCLLFRYLRIRIGNPETDASNFDSKMSKIGDLLSDVIAVRVMLVVVSLLAILPHLSIFILRPWKLNTSETLNLIEQFYTVDALEKGVSYIEDSFGQNLLFLSVVSSVNSSVYVVKDNLGVPPSLLEDLTFIDKSALWHSRAMHLNMRNTEVYVFNTQRSLLYIDVSSILSAVSARQFGIMLLVLLVFLIGNLMVSHDAHQLVVQPVERMTSIVRKLAGTIFILSNANEVEGQSEAEFLEAVVGRMASIFKVQPGAAVHTRGKAMSMMAGQKSTEIKTNYSVYKINVTETPPAAQSDVAVIKRQNLQTQQLITSEEINIDDHPELKSFDAVLQSPSASHYLKMFMDQKLNLENYLFWNDVEKFKDHFRSNAQRVVQTYIVKDSQHRLVNILSESMMDQLIKIDLHEPISHRIFDSAQKDVYTHLEQVYYALVSNQ